MQCQLDDIKQVCKYVNTLAMLDRYKVGMYVNM